MKNILKKIVATIVFIASGAPLLALAQNNGVTSGLVTSGVGGLFGSGGLSGATSLTDLITRAIQLMLLFAGAIAVVFVIIGGYWYITSAGNEETAEKGQKTLTNAIIGIVIIVLSYAIITVISNLVSSPNGYGF
jgi:prepilin signal peptidase PulO-like enzyme (type II secretory pathway)